MPNIYQHDTKAKADLHNFYNLVTPSGKSVGRPMYDVAPVSIFSLTWVLWVLRNFQRFTLHYIITLGLLERQMQNR